MEYTRHKAYEDSNILLDKNDFLIIEPLTSKAANYFLSRDKWTGLEKKLTKEGDSYYIVIDRNSEKKYQIYKPYKSKVIYMDGNDVKIKKNDFLDEIEPILLNIPNIRILNEILDLKTTYFILKSLLKNPKSDLTYLSDELISEIKVIEKSPGATRIYLDISLEDLMDILQVREDSYERDFIQYTVGSTYSSWNYGSSDRSWEEFSEGYIFRSFNQENIEKLEEICFYFQPNVKSVGIGNLSENEMRTLTSTLDDKVSRQVSEIRDIWEEFTEECYTKTSEEYLENAFCNCFSEIDLFKKKVSQVNCSGLYLTSLKTLLNLYEKSNSQYLSVKDMLKSVLNEELDVEHIINGECYRTDWKDEEYNIKMSNVLDEMKEIVEENIPYENLEDYKKILDFITKKFEFDRWYELPKDESKQISFQSVDPETNLIHYLFVDKKAKTGIKKGKKTLEDINLLLYHPEFDFED